MSNTATLESPAAPEAGVPAAVAGPVDIFGKAIAARDMIVYATRKGSDTFLNKLSVIEVGPGYIQGFNPDDPTRRKRTITSLGTVAKVS